MKQISDIVACASPILTYAPPPIQIPTLKLQTMSLRLVYFNARGVIEAARIMLAIKGVEYVDERYPIDIATYSKPEFDADKAAGKFVVNMDRVPLLYVGDQVIGQSKTIERFVAKHVGMMGSTPVEEAQIDMIGEHVRDIKDKYAAAKGQLKGDDLEAAKLHFVTVQLPDWVAKLSKALPGSDFAVGSSLSLADVQLALLFEYFDHKEQAKEVAMANPKMKQAVESVQAAAAHWLATRPDTKV